MHFIGPDESPDDSALSGMECHESCLTCDMKLDQESCLTCKEGQWLNDDDNDLAGSCDYLGTTHKQ